MSLPEPQAGMVIHYGYLWARQSVEKGLAGEKDRPCVILAVSGDETGTTVFASPITHTAPYHAEEALLLPAGARARLGLDERPCWLMCSEVNEFTWPGLDLRRIPHREPRAYIYGSLPAALVVEARDLLEACSRKPAFKQVPRDSSPGPANP